MKFRDADPHNPYRLVLDNISLVIFVVDANSGKVIFVNDRANAEFGDLIGKPLPDTASTCNFIGYSSITWVDGRLANLFYAEAASHSQAGKETESHGAGVTVEQMRRAMMDNFNEFQLFFQPAVELTTRKWTCAEAFIRWEDPQRGMQPPSSFLPLLEKSGLMSSVNEWVLSTACFQCAQWQKLGLYNTSLSVNISTSQLLRPDFHDLIENALGISGLKPELLMLEIEDSREALQYSTVFETLNRLRSIGVRTVLDMSSGQSNLYNLNILPLDMIKTDPIFCTQVIGNSHIKKLFQMIVELSHDVNLTVCAKGVEDEEQYEYVKEAGCDLAQGFYLSRPLPPASYYRAAMVEAAKNGNVLYPEVL